MGRRKVLYGYRGRDQTSGIQVLEDGLYVFPSVFVDRHGLGYTVGGVVEDLRVSGLGEVGKMK